MSAVLPAPSHSPRRAGGDDEPTHAVWQELLAQVGEEVSVPLTEALECVNALCASGRIDRQTAVELRDHLERARRSGLAGQQLARYARGRVRAQPETVPLTQLLKDVLVQRSRDFHARGLAVRTSFVETRVLADAAIVFAMVNSLIDWCVEQSRGAVDLRLELGGWPIQARLRVRFMHVTAGAPGQWAHTSCTLAWRLVEQGARVLELPLRREDQGVETEVHLVFPRTVPSHPQSGASHEEDLAGAAPTNSRPLAGSHVMVVASRREVRQQVRESLVHMGLILDFVPSLAEAQEFCRGGVPHAVIYEGVLGGQRFDAFRDALRAEVPTLVFIEIVEDGDRLERPTPAGAVARVGRRALRAGLPYALKTELSKNL